MDELYNGLAIYVYKVNIPGSHLTTGRVYNFTNGKTIDNKGKEFPSGNITIDNLVELKRFGFKPLSNWFIYYICRLY